MGEAAGMKEGGKLPDGEVKVAAAAEEGNRQRSVDAGGAIDEEGYIPSKIDQEEEMKSLERVLSAYLYYPHAMELNVQRWERSYNKLKPHQKALVPEFPEKFANLRRCIATNAYFISCMLQAFEPPFDMDECLRPEPESEQEAEKRSEESCLTKDGGKHSRSVSDPNEERQGLCSNSARQSDEESTKLTSHCRGVLGNNTNQMQTQVRERGDSVQMHKGNEYVDVESAGGHSQSGGKWQVTSSERSSVGADSKQQGPFEGTVLECSSWGSMIAGNQQEGSVGSRTTVANVHEQSHRKDGSECTSMQNWGAGSHHAEEGGRWTNEGGKKRMQNSHVTNGARPADLEGKHGTIAAGIEENEEFPFPQRILQSLHKQRRVKRVAHQDVEKVCCMLRSIVRDWSEEGARERMQCYDPILSELKLYFPNRRNQKPHPNCLVPGAGLGRLCCEVSRLGFVCQGNEFSYYTLVCSSFILNNTMRANEWALHPWIHSNCNVVSDQHQIRPIYFPDLHPGSAGITEGLSMCAGDFVEVYSHPAQREAWDSVVTCFFIDTAHNILDYIEIIANILKPGGVWINFGPLLYHFADMDLPSDDDMSLEISLECVKRIAAMKGFILKQEKIVETTYTANSLSLMQNHFYCAFWTMIKNGSVASAS